MARRQKKKQPATPGPLTVSDRIQRQLAALAIEKVRGGQQPTSREEAALRRLEIARDERQRWLHYRAVPKGDYVRLSGRKHSVLNNQADRHGIPLRGRTVDLQAVLHWVHDLLGRHGQKLKSLDDADPLLQGTPSPELERYRGVKRKLAELELGRLSGDLIPRAELEPGLDLLTKIIREAGETLRRGYGEDAALIFDEAIEDWNRGWRALLNAQKEEPGGGGL